ncbi:hypothetical protein R1flu_004317 [Riccia fluitans]|uniref:Ycf15 n=1 Tax=Riccia fluitans TaxID=41844 RepID=A0ABD1YPX7_9MARC
MVPSPNNSKLIIMISMQTQLGCVNTYILVLRRPANSKFGCGDSAAKDVSTKSESGFERFQVQTIRITRRFPTLT